MAYSNLREISLRNRSHTLERAAWTLCESTSPPTTAFLFLDGELYIERVWAVEVLRRARAAEAVPDFVAFFLSHGNSAARHSDFVCCPNYASFVAEDVVDRIRQDFRSVSQFVLVGLSLSGLAAADVATRYPGVFSSVVCQSPSFWWQRGRFAEELPGLRQPSPKFWISVGDQETETGIAHPPSGLQQELSQVAGCAVVVAALCAKGYVVRSRSFNGGHDPECWRVDLELSLPWTCRQVV